MNTFTKRATSIAATGALSVGLIAGGVFGVGAAGATELPVSTGSSAASVLGRDTGLTAGVAADTSDTTETIVKTVAQLRSDLRAAIRLDATARPAALTAIRAEVAAGGYGEKAQNYLPKFDRVKNDAPKHTWIGLRHFLHNKATGGDTSTPTPAPTPTPTPGS
jgi:hypothetical protein